MSEGAPAETEEVIEALNALWQEVPAVNKDAVWRRVEPGLGGPRRRPLSHALTGWLPRLGPARTMGSSWTRFAGMTASVVIIAAALISVLGGGGAPQSALAAAQELSLAAESAVSGEEPWAGDFSQLRNQVSDLLARLSGDPEALDSLSEDEISTLIAILRWVQLQLASHEAATGWEDTLALLREASAIAERALSQRNGVPLGELETLHLGPAGAITLETDGAVIRIVGLAMATGWDVHRLDADPRQVRLDLRRGVSRVRFEGRLVGRQLEGKLRIEAVMASDAAPEGVHPPTGTTPAETSETLVFAAGAAGTVTASRHGQGIRLISVQPAAGWTFELGGESDRIEIEFQSGRERVRIRIEMVDGELEARVEVRVSDETGSTAGGSGASPTVGPSATPQTFVFTAGAAGSVTLQSDGERLKIARVDPTEGWTPRIVTSEGDEIEVQFESQDDRVQFRARLRDGAIELR